MDQCWKKKLEEKVKVKFPLHDVRRDERFTQRRQLGTYGTIYRCVDA